MRNNIVHRGINHTDETILVKNISEIDKLIEKMKKRG